MKNIVLLGAGGAAFTIKLVRDLVLTESLKDAAIRLVDIDEKKLDDTYKAVLLFNKEAGSSLKVEKYTDRRKAFDGADFIICTVKIGGYVPLEQERKIAEAHGYYRGIGDRVSCYFGGVGAYWQLKFMQEIAADIEELCPDAYLIQSSNPVFDTVSYLSRYTKVKAVGICHGHNGVYEVADILGMERDKVSFEVLGFNHQIYLTKFRYQGKDAYPLLDQWIEEKAEKYWKSEKYLSPNHLGFSQDTLSKGAIDAYRLYGLLPIGDAMRSASPWWHHIDFAEKEKWYGPGGGFDSETSWPTYLKYMNGQRELMAETIAKGESLRKDFPLEHSMEEHIPLLEAIVTDIPARFVVNVPNGGAIPGIPDDVVVEMPAIIDAGGIQGIRTQALPQKIMDHIIYPRMRMMNNIVGAFHEGDRERLVLELMQDPRTHSYMQAKNLIDELLAQPWNEEADKHYV